MWQPYVQASNDPQFWPQASSVFGEVGIDLSKVSFVPVDGWIEVDVGNQTVWVIDEAYVAHVMTSFGASAGIETTMDVVRTTLDANGNLVPERDAQGSLIKDTVTVGLQKFLDDMAAAWNQLQTAQRVFAAAQDAFERLVDEVNEWLDRQVDLYQQMLTALYAEVQQAFAAVQACFRRCASKVEPEDDGLNRIGLFVGSAVALAAGVIGIGLGQPFDTGTEAILVTQPVIQVVEDEEPPLRLRLRLRHRPRHQLRHQTRCPRRR